MNRYQLVPIDYYFTAPDPPPPSLVARVVCGIRTDFCTNLIFLWLFRVFGCSISAELFSVRTTRVGAGVESELNGEEKRDGVPPSHSSYPQSRSGDKRPVNRARSAAKDQKSGKSHGVVPCRVVVANYTRPPNKTYLHVGPARIDPTPILDAE